MNILELLDKYGLEVQKQGDLLVGFCPFHKDENRPNFTIYPETNSYFCYTCNEGGNNIRFYAEMEGITYREAEQKLNGNLSELIAKINKEPEEPLYNDVANLQISLKFKDILKASPELLDKIKEIMKYADEQLTKDFKQDDAVTFLLDINSRLNNLKAECINNSSSNKQEIV